VKQKKKVDLNKDQGGAFSTKMALKWGDKTRPPRKNKEIGLGRDV